MKKLALLMIALVMGYIANAQDLTYKVTSITYYEKHNKKWISEEGEILSNKMYVTVTGDFIKIYHDGQLVNDYYIVRRLLTTKEVISCIGVDEDERNNYITFSLKKSGLELSTVRENKKLRFKIYQID